jgi:8-oxo-dGTP diphosphatase
MDPHIAAAGFTADGRQAITACAFIHLLNGNVPQVFLARRADTKAWLPGAFEVPGGHIEYGEDIRAGLQREIMEEFGMEIAVGDPFAVFTYKNDATGTHSIEVVYFATFTTPIEQLRLNPKDHSEWVWAEEASLGAYASANKKPEDDEFKAVRKGFALLEGGRPDFGRAPHMPRA